MNIFYHEKAQEFHLQNQSVSYIMKVLKNGQIGQLYYVLVNPDYQGMGIAGKMIEYIKEKYKDFMYIDGMPEDKKNVPFYQKHGFSLMENGAAIQICNYENV